MLYTKHKNKRLSIMDFSHIYEKETFFLKENVNWVDCSDLTGINCYCEKDTESEIKKRISNLPLEGLHFIDSGNFHYVTKFWTEKIAEDFTLVVFDHHSDMQKPLFGDILSCGSWILDVLKDNRFVKKVILIGISKEQEQMIPSAYKDRIVPVDEEAIKSRSFWKQCSENEEKYPLYISVDKDVLSKNVIDTSWDQGNMQLTELKNILHILFEKQKIIGIDICGECKEELEALSDISDDDRLNENLLQFLKNETKEFEK